MRTVYICEMNCSIHKSINNLVIKKNGYKLYNVPIFDVSQIILFGNTQITSQTFNMLFEKGIDVIFMSSTGRIKGRILSDKSNNVVLRIAQYKKWTSKENRLSIAKNIIKFKLENQIKLLNKYYYYRKDKEIKIALENILKSKKIITTCNSINSLLGIEGSAAKEYFSTFKYLLNDYNFKTRSRRPAKDYVNALLNLTYSFLSNEIVSRLSLFSFDLELGFLHGIRYGRKSLALDIMEEFRSSFADNFVIKILNKKNITIDDFKNSTEFGYKLKEDKLKRYCELYQQYINYEPEKNLNWRTIFDRQIKRFRKYILEGVEYESYNQL